MSLIPEFVEPQKSSAGKLSLVQYESGQQEGEGRAAKTPKKRYFILKLLFVITGWRRSNRTFAPEFFLNGVFNLFTPKFFELFPDVCDHPVKYVAVGKVFFRKSLKRSP